MLPYRSHWHFAFEHEPERERRLLRFAAKDDDGSGSMEGTPEDGSEANESPESKPISLLRESFTGHLERLSKPIAKGTASSMFLLDQVLTFPELKDEKLTQKIERRIEELRLGRGNTVLADELAEELITYSEEPQFLTRLTRAFEARLEYYKELHDQIGDEKILARVTAIEEKLVLMAGDAQGNVQDEQDALRYMTSNTKAWETPEGQKELDKILDSLGIEKTIPLPTLTDDMSTEQKRAIESVRKTMSKGTKPDTKFLLERVQHKLSAARRLVNTERLDLGTDSTTGTFAAVETKMWKQYKHIRTHLERVVQKKADELQMKLMDKVAWAAKACEDPQQKAEIERMYGISAIDLLHRIGEHAEVLRNALRGSISIDGNKQDTNGHLKKALDKSFLPQVEKFISQFSEIERALEGATKEEVLKNFTEDLRVVEADKLDWIQDVQPRLLQAAAQTTDTIQQENLSKLAEKYTSYIGKNRAELSTEEGEELAELTLEEMRTVELTIQSVLDTEVAKSIEIAEEYLLKKQDLENTEKTREHLRNEFRHEKKKLLSHGALSHDICAALRIQNELHDFAFDTESKLHLAQAKEETEERKKAFLQTAAAQIDIMHEATEALDAAQNASIVRVNTQEMQERTGTSEAGFYEFASNTIYLNTDKKTTYVEEHERGHAILHALTRTVPILPKLLLESFESLQDIPTDNDSGDTLKSILYRLGSNWGIPETLPEEERKKLLMDEAWNQYATWKQSDEPKKQNPDFNTLMRILDNHVHGKPQTGILSMPVDTARGLASSGIGDESTEENESGGGKMPSDAENMLVSNIEDLKAKIASIDAFLLSYPSLAEGEQLRAWNDQNKKLFEERVMKPFKNNVSADLVSKNIMNLDSDMEKVIEAIDKFKKEQLNVSKAPATGKAGWRRVFAHVEFVSIYDMINMVKSGAEDVQRMWKRRGARVQSNVGTLLTGIVPDNHLWGLEYLGQLKHEYQRRSADSEVEEVEQWKKAFKDLDSFQLLEYMAISRNRDQVRAISEILSERGRLDFNDVRFWRTLNDLSNFHMPIEACKNNDLLRDKWLQKLIADIWGDKDKFVEWRQANDGGIDSGKKKFTQTVDQLSNISGGLSDTLRRQLTLWVSAKEKGETPPEEVNPHLYEETLHYAMRNGKMYMEDKLFYLVQGVRYRLLSIDRLRALAGENGGVLNQFPFIDYFYGGNNTLSEVTALGRRLDEDDGQFKPGAKTTLWIHLELTRNESARARMAKAMSGERTQALDHEDIPTIVSQVDHTGITEMTGVLSGTRFKISPEAVKNAYTGFGTKFKVLSKLAQMDEDNEARFSTQDALEAAKSIVAYVHMDNIFTRNGAVRAERPELTWQQINNNTAPSSNGLKIKDYRDGNQELVTKILDSDILDADAWKRINDSVGAQDSFLNKNTIARRLGDESYIKDDGMKRWNSMKSFEEELMKALSKKENQEKLKDILVEIQNKFKEEGYGKKSIEEKDQHIKLSVMQNYMRERNQQIFQPNYNELQMYPEEK